MIAVVCDTSPINYLCLIGAIGLLPKLFDRILVPGAVFAELQSPSAPPAVLRLLNQHPAWLEVVEVRRVLDDLQLDLGETEAISLAVELNIATVLIDEKAGRRVAQARGLATFGTLAILNAGDVLGALKLEDALAHLRQTNFRLRQPIVDELLNDSRARRAT